jgi:hypothetical protein
MSSLRPVEVPTFNSYSSEAGYFIYARLHDIGNITYQVSPEGSYILEELGFGDGDEIGWPVIEALRIPGLIYTGGGGMSDHEDMDVTASGGSSAEGLSEGTRMELLEKLSQLNSVDSSQASKIEDVLDIGSGMSSDPVEMELNQRFADLHDSTELPAAWQPFEEHAPVVNLIRESRDEQSDHLLIRTSYSTNVGRPFEVRFVMVEFRIDHRRRVSGVMITSDMESTWERQAEACEYVGAAIPMIVDALRAAGIDVGPPWSDIAIEFDRL